MEGLYIRELPIDVHTKFIETHTGILKNLLDFLLPDTRVSKDETRFEKRYSLKHKPSIIRFRILDASVSQDLARLPITDLAIPIDEFTGLHLTCNTIYIVENEINFLTFPLIENSIVIWGKGFAVEQL